MHVRRIRIPSAARVMCCDDRRRRSPSPQPRFVRQIVPYVASLAGSRPQSRQDKKEENSSSPTQAPSPSHTMPLPRSSSPHHDVARRDD